MIDYFSIEVALHRIDMRYQKSDGFWMTSLSKFALIEFCGWIEVSFDSMFESYIEKNLTGPTQKLARESVKKNHGFHYEGNFRRIFCMLLGANGLDLLERNVGNGDIQVLGSMLGDLKKKRDEAAHTHTKGTQQFLCSPSDILKKFLQIKPIIKKIENELLSISSKNAS